MGFLKSVTLIAGAVLLMAFVGFGQSPTPEKGQSPTTEKGKKKKTDKNKAEVIRKSPIVAPPMADGSDAKPTPDPNAASPEEDKRLEGEILPYYENYLREYRLGPADQISVEVFGQCPDYCKTGITIPPNAKISYPLIREGIFVAGKTVEDIAAEITKRLDEYIIDPKVTVTLDKAVATRYSVMGNVGQPGVRIMDRRVSVYEAVVAAGGVTREGDRKKVAIVSYGKNGRLERRVVNLADMENGKAEVVFLEPGDQVFVPGKGFTIAKIFDILSRASTLRYMIPSPASMIPSLPTLPYIP